jgi:uncharacterized membrane protein
VLPYYSPAIAGFVWSGGTLTYLPPWYYMYPDENFSTARAINDGGIAIGRWAGGTPSSPSSYVPCFWYPDYFDGYSVYMNTLPGIPGGTATLSDAAEDINNPGIIVGEVGAPGGSLHAVAWQPSGYGYYPPSSIHDLSSIAGTGGSSLAAAVNDGGVVVGKSQYQSGSGYHAFRSSASSGFPNPLTLADDMGTATLKDTDSSEARDVNNLNELVGVSWSVTAQTHAMYKASTSGKNQGWHDLGVLGQGTPDAGDYSRANGINNKGLIVGQSTVYVQVAPWARVLLPRAFIFSNEGNPESQFLINLTDQTDVDVGGQMYPAASQGWAVINAERINENNWIVGTATYNGQTRAVLLIPQ